MTLLPVIARELRVSARQPFSYNVRTLAASALLLTSVIVGLRGCFEPNNGGALFVSLHGTMFFALWILVPLLTADCLSREKREGTLELLFLTRLKAHDIVLAKSVAHFLRGLTLWLAVLPVCTLPFLIGGIGWHEALFSF